MEMKLVYSMSFVAMLKEQLKYVTLVENGNGCRIVPICRSVRMVPVSTRQMETMHPLMEIKSQQTVMIRLMAKSRTAMILLTASSPMVMIRSVRTAMIRLPRMVTLQASPEVREQAVDVRSRVVRP